MSFQFSDRSKDLQLRISMFLDDHVYPAEEIYAQQMEEFTQQGNRWQIPQIIEDKKEVAKSEGLWNLFLPENPMGESMSILTMLLLQKSWVDRELLQKFLIVQLQIQGIWKFWPNMPMKSNKKDG